MLYKIKEVNINNIAQDDANLLCDVDYIVFCYFRPEFNLMMQILTAF